jgi:MATE family multidrug resistance protein
LDFSKIRILGAALGTVLSRIMMVVFMHYLMKQNSALKKIFLRISVLKKSANQF